MQTKYNYIFYSAHSYHKYMLPNSSTCRVCVNAINTKNRFLNLLFKLHWSEKINKIVNLPLKHLWFSTMYGKPFANDKPNCYVFLAGKYAKNNKQFLEYIKKRDTRNKTIVYYLDLISKKYTQDIQEIIDNSDLVVSYEPSEAEQYNIQHIEEDYYSTPDAAIKATSFTCDVFFLGYAKGRQEELIYIAKHFSRNGISCRFLLVGVPELEQILCEGICYSEPIPYKCYLKEIQKSKCLLELIQKDSTANTLRYNEAIAYNRKLITNQPNIKSKHAYDARYISTFENAEDIDINFIKEPIDYTTFDTVKTIAPEKRLQMIERLLDQREHH